MINYACKEFEQTGTSEIERIYLDTEISLSTKDLQLHSSAIDTFQFQSIDASVKHFEKLFQSDLPLTLCKHKLRLAFMLNQIV